MNIKIKSKGMTCLIGGDYEKIYRSLSQRLNGDYEGLFTERVPGNDYLQWNLPGDGWKPLSESDQITGNEVRRQLDDRLQQVRQLFGNNTVLADKVLTIPSEDYVFYKIESNGQFKIALTAWGYRYPDRVIGNTSLVADLEQHSKENVMILVTCEGKPAAREVLTVNGMRHTSDENGNINLGAVSAAIELFIEDQYGNKHNVTVAPGKSQIAIDVPAPPVLEDPEPPAIDEPEPPAIDEPEPPAIDQPEPPAIDEPEKKPQRSPVLLVVLLVLLIAIFTVVTYFFSSIFLGVI